MSNKKKIHAYAIIRFESDHHDVNAIVTVKKIVFDIEYAEQEVKRLNNLNGDKGCIYFWQTTRLENNEIERLVSMLDDLTEDN